MCALARLGFQFIKYGMGLRTCSIKCAQWAVQLVDKRGPSEGVGVDNMTIVIVRYPMMLRI